MTDKEKMRFLEKLTCNVKIGLLIMDNHGTMNFTNNMESGRSKKKEDREMPSWDIVAKAIQNVQELFWGNSSYAVLYCVFSDYYSYRAVGASTSVK